MIKPYLGHCRTRPEEPFLMPPLSNRSILPLLWRQFMNLLLRLQLSCLNHHRQVQFQSLLRLCPSYHHRCRPQFLKLSIRSHHRQITFTTCRSLSRCLPNLLR